MLVIQIYLCFKEGSVLLPIDSSNSVCHRLDSNFEESGENLNNLESISIQSFIGNQSSQDGREIFGTVDSDSQI